MSGFDVFPDMDRLPAPTSHAALSSEVARLRSRLEQLQEYLERCSHKRNEIGKALDAEREMHERTRIEVKRLEVEHYDDAEQITQIARLEEATRGDRDAARQALRDLVDAAIDHRVAGYRLVSEEEMQRVAALVREWYGSASEKGERR